MAEITLVIGSDTRCADDKLPGELRHVVVDYTTRAVTQIRQGSSLNGRRVATRSEIMSEFARLRKRLQQNI